MALTEQEETKVRTIITAFEGAKRVSELPAGVTGTPFELTLEVLDKDGETKQSPLATMLPYIEDQVSYGVEIDTAVSASALTRVGSSDLHKRLPIQSRMKGCILSDSGVVVQYLHPTNWNGFTLDGSLGQIMVEIPDHYRKFTVNGSKIQARISELPIPGYHLVKKMYISSFEASIQRSTGKLCSLVNAAADYRGGDNNAGRDGTNSTFLGRPVTGISRTDFRSAARMRNADTKWNCQDYNAYKAMYWLYTIEYSNTNGQLAVNAELDVNGYKQGGIGSGITDWDSTWGTFNSYNSFVPCGHTNSLGNQSGEVAYAIKDVDNVTTIKTVYANRYRGVENPFGHVLKWMDGINIEVGAVNSTVYVANDPDNYDDSNCSGYTNSGLQSRLSGYISKMILGEFGELIASEVTGGSTTGWCDYFYADTNQGLRGVLAGGGAVYGAGAGFGYSGTGNAPSIADASVGSRLCYIP